MGTPIGKDKAEEIRAEARRLKRAKGTGIYLAKKYGLTKQTISAILNNRRYTGKPRSTPDPSRYATKYNEELVRKFKQRVAAGEDKMRVAELLGISRATAKAIVQGRRWGHVTIDNTQGE